MLVGIKRAYEEPAPGDGKRVLVDRLWPRGVSKAEAAIHAWLRDLAPSDALRRWYHARPGMWDAFRKRYLEELSEEKASRALEELYRMAARGRVTLVYASRNEERNNATVLRDLLTGMRKPPTSSGPERRAAMRARRARPRPR